MSLAIALVGMSKASPPSITLPTYSSTFGSRSDGNGAPGGGFENPGGDAVDSSGNIWVADTEDKRIEEFNSSGEFVRKFGIEGSGNGQLIHPTAVAVSAAGNVWVADTGNNRMEEFSGTGVFVRSIGSLGTGNGQFNSPEGVAIDSKGNVWVADTGNNRIQELTENGVFVRVVGNGAVGNPKGIAIGPGNRIWVAATSLNKVIEYSEVGALLRSFGSEGSGNGQFKGPAALTVDQYGTVWVVDSGNERVEGFNQAGTYGAQFGSYGDYTTTGKFNFAPRDGIAADASGNLWVVDTLNERVQKWHVPAPLPTYSSLFGTAGAGNTTPGGQFQHPGGDAIDTSGNVWVADTENNRIQEFNSKGEFLRKFGTEGSGNGQLNHPSAVALNAAGSAVWVADSNNNRIEEFSSAGTFIRAVGGPGAGNANGSFWRPEGIAIDSAGNVWVADTENSRIQELSETGAYIRTVQLGGKAKGIAIGPGNNVWVAVTSLSKVMEFSSTGATLRTIGSEGTAPGQLRGPAALTVDPSGTVWVADSGNGRVEGFGPTGLLVGQFGSAGTSTGQFGFAARGGIAADTSGNLWVVDTGNNRVQKWVSTPVAPTYLSKFGYYADGNTSPGGRFKGPGGEAIDSSGNLWIADSEDRRIQEFNSKGEFVRKFGSDGTGNGQMHHPTDIAVSAAGNVWVADTGNSRLEEFSGTGEFLKTVGAAGTGNGQFNAPEGIAIDRKGNIWVADTGNNRLQELNEKGEFVKIVGAGAVIAPKGLAIGSGNSLWVAAFGSNKVFEYNAAGERVQAFGSEGSGNGQFKHPTTLTVDPSGTVWVVDYGNARVDGFTQGGEYVGQFGSFGDATTTGKFNFAPYGGIVSDASGNLWIADTYNDRVQKWTAATPGPTTGSNSASAGPVAEYSFDEGPVENVTDLTGNGHTATIHGAEWTRHGKYGGAMEFDHAQNDYLSVPDSPELDFNDEFTLEAWVRPSEAEHVWQPILIKQYGEGKGENKLAYRLSAGQAQQKPFADVEGAAGETAGATGEEALPRNVWSHVAMTYDGSKVRIYVDGKLEEEAAAPAPRVTHGDLEIGGSTEHGNYFDGRIDEVRVYSRSLSGSEVDADMETPIQTPKAGPVAAWSFDEGEGTVAHDATDNGSEGSLSAEGVEWAPGRFGSSLQFDGSKGCVTVPDSAQLRPSEEFTLEAWVRPEGSLLFDPAITKQAEGFPAYALGVGLVNPGKPGGEIGAELGLPSNVESSTSLEANVWQHEALTFDGAELRLYVEGELVASQPVEHTNSSASGPLEIGCGSSGHFKGRIDEVRIYGRALSTAEVATDRAVPVQAPKAGPVAAWSFDEGEGNEVHDATNDGNEGTLSGGVEWVAGHNGSALRFNGSGCVTVPDSPQLRPSEEFTLEAWVRPEGELLHDPAITKQAEGFPAYALGVGLSTEGLPEGRIGTESHTHSDVESSAALEADAWQHEALTYDGAKLRLYVGGELVATRPVDHTNSAAPGPLEIGCAAGQHFRGRIDEVRVYDRALDGSEVAVDEQTPIETPKEGPVAAWSFDEDEGNVAHDDTGNGNEAVLSAEGVGWRTRRKGFGSELGFNGTTGCVTVPNFEALSQSRELTLEAWVEPEAGPEGELTNLPILFDGTSSESPDYELGIGIATPGRGEGRLLPFGKSVHDVKTPEKMGSGQLALTFDGATIRFYLNGKLVATESVQPYEVLNSVKSLTIGCAPGQHFRGGIDDVRIYRRALDPGEIAVDEQAPVEAPESGPIAAWSFDEGEGTAIYDATGNGNEGTISAEGVKWAPGRHGSALQFDGTSGCVTVPDLKSVGDIQGLTVDAWVRPEGELSQLPIFTTSKYEIGIGEETKGHGEVRFSSGKLTTGFATPTAMEANVWQHLTLTFAPIEGEIKLYLNGVPVTRGVTSSFMYETLGPIEIGCSATHHFRGRIDDVRVYNRTLDPQEVATDEQTPVPTTKAGPPPGGTVGATQVAAFPLDEGETATTAADSVEGGPMGTLSAEGVKFNPTGGRYGGALQFDGTDGCVTIPDSTALQLKEDFTLESWVRPEGELTHLPILYKAGEGSPAYDLGIGLTTPRRGEGQIGTGSGSSRTATSPTSLEAEVWQHLAVSYDGGNLRLYVNGELVTTQPVTGTNSGVPGGALTIGCGGGHFFKGRIDEVRIYDRALGAGEIAVDRGSPLQTPKHGPVAEYSFDEGSGETVADLTNDGHTATIEGAEWTTHGRYGDGLNFVNTPGDVLKIPDSPAFDLTEELTLEAWVKPVADHVNGAIITKETPNFISYALYAGGGNRPAEPMGWIAPKPYSGPEMEGPKPLTPHAWSHLALTYDGSKMKLYVNGELVAERAAPTPETGEGPLEIGGATAFGDYFEGTIDEVRIYNRALNAEEVAVDKESPIQTPKHGPVAAFSFDEAASLGHDSVEGGPEGTPSAEGLESKPGRFGGALQFDGTNGCVTIPDTEALRLGEEFTLESWVRPEGELSQLPILYKAGEGSPAYDLGIGLTTPRRAAGQIGTTSGSRSITSPAALRAGVWQHLAVSYDGARLRLYVDGELVETQPVTGASSGVAGGALTIGCGGGSYFRGRIDEVRIYNRALASGEVAVDRGVPIQTPSSGPIASFPLDEAESATTATDSSGGGHTGTLSGSGVKFNPTAGRYGGALQFTGTNGCMTLANPETLALGEEFTLEAWVRPEGELIHLPILWKDGGGFPAYDLSIGLISPGKGETQIGTISKSRFSVASPASLEAGVWQHLAATYDGSQMRLYLNGELVAAKAVSATDSDAPGALTIGCGGGSYFRGRIDEVRIYNRALEAGEVAVAMEEPLQTPKAGPVAAWSFDAGEGTTVEDITGDGHPATIEGAEWTTHGRYGGALAFNGTSSCLSVADAADLRLGEDFTLEAWVRPEGELRGDPIIFKEGSGFPNYALDLGHVSTGKAESSIGITASPNHESATSTASLEADVWTHLATTYDGSKIRLYKNGELVATKAVTGASSGREGAFKIGCDSQYSEHFHGMIDEARVYDRALNAAELTGSMSRYAMNATFVRNEGQYHAEAVAQLTYPTTGDEEHRNTPHILLSVAALGPVPEQTIMSHGLAAASGIVEDREYVYHECPYDPGATQVSGPEGPVETEPIDRLQLKQMVETATVRSAVRDCPDHENGYHWRYTVGITGFIKYDYGHWIEPEGPPGCYAVPAPEVAQEEAEDKKIEEEEHRHVEPELENLAPKREEGCFYNTRYATRATNGLIVIGRWVWDPGGDSDFYHPWFKHEAACGKIRGHIPVDVPSEEEENGETIYTKESFTIFHSGIKSNGREPRACDWAHPQNPPEAFGTSAGNG